MYVLSVDGYYASPERDTANSGMISTDAADPYDYRGEQNMATWTKIAEGEISSEDLTQDLIVGSLLLSYSLPQGAFRVHIPPNGGVRSFYIQTSPAGLLYANPRVGKGLNDGMDMYASYPSPGQHHPLMLVGEGFVGQSLPGGRVGMSDDPSLYSPEVFLGRVYYEWVHDEWGCVSSSSSLTPSEGTHGETLEGGLVLSISMKCNEGGGLEDLSEETRLAVVDAVESAAERAVAESNPYLISNIAAELLAAHCVVGGAAQRRLSGDAGQTVVQGDIMEFSVLITADYVPPKPRPGKALFVSLYFGISILSY